MGESACLLRTYSQPSSSSPKTKQVELLRCLTSSTSLGRYMSESLDWEKWSTFTVNRHMEDVKKHSRPGVVAQMKAHFEAHFKKKATEKAAALNEQQNPVSRTDLDKSLIQISNHVARGKTLEEEAISNMVSNSVEASRWTRPCGEVQASEGAQFVEAEENHQLVDQVDISKRLEDFPASRCNQNIEGREQDHTQFAKVENPLTSDKVDVCGQFDNIKDDGKGACREDAKTHTTGIGELGDPASLEKRKPVFLPFKSRGNVGVIKPPAPPKPSVPIHKKQSKKANLGSRENVADVEISKAATRSFHMSVELSPKVKKKPMSPILQRLVNSRLVKTIAGKANQSTQGKPLQDTVVQEHPSVSLQQKMSRSRNIQPPTVCRPFNFKSEDRAIKRKEFFERLKENAKTKKEEIAEVQESSKVKPRNDAITQGGHLLATSKVGPCSDSKCRSRTPSAASKVTPKLPDSPFVSGETLKHNNARPPWRFTTSGKEVTAKKSQSPARPLKSVSKKSNYENDSPNVQL